MLGLQVHWVHPVGLRWCFVLGLLGSPLAAHIQEPVGVEQDAAGLLWLVPQGLYLNLNINFIE